MSSLLLLTCEVNILSRPDLFEHLTLAAAGLVIWQRRIGFSILGKNEVEHNIVFLETFPATIYFFHF